MESLLSYSPSSITFSITLGIQTATHLTLTNITTHPIAYKVKTTHLKRYCVRPNAAILAPAETLTVELIQQAHHAPPSDLDDCRDRFLLQAVTLSDIPNLPPNTPVATVWELAPAHVILKTKFAVRLQLAAHPYAKTSYHLPPRPSTPPAASHPVPKFPSLTESKPSVLTDSQPRLPFSQHSNPALSQQAAQPAESSTPSSPPPVRPPALPPTAPPSSQKPLPIEQSSSAFAPNSSPAKPTAPKMPTATAAAANNTDDIDYKSVAYNRSRALGVRPAPNISPPTLDPATRERVVVEREAQLSRAITDRQEHIDETKRELVEARLKLSDAQMATRPAYDVRFEIDESARIPLVQTCVMALISGTLLSLLLGN